MCGKFSTSMDSNAEMQHAKRDFESKYVDAKAQVRSVADLKNEIGASISEKGASIEAGVNTELVAFQAHGEIDTKEYDIPGVKFKVHSKGDLNALALGGSLSGQAKFLPAASFQLKSLQGHPRCLEVRLSLDWISTRPRQSPMWCQNLVGCGGNTVGDACLL